MATYSLINPLDQPTGKRRLLGELSTALDDERFSSFYFIVAYAKSGPLLRLQQIIKKRKTEGLSINAIFGLDQQGTTAQALQFALENFDSVHVTREPNLTFHPKMYAFVGRSHARLFVGSNNLTVGGTETNFEAAVALEMELPNDADVLKSFTDCWVELLPENCPATNLLDQSLLNDLIRVGTVPDEVELQKNRAAAAASKSGAPKPPKSGLKIKPPSTLPAKKTAKKTVSNKVKTKTAVAGPSAPTIEKVNQSVAQGLAIQIKPHHNGEIFLSVTAALQNPDFFRWPFNGLTVPKKAGNPAYPQLDPDPVVNIVVYGENLEVKLMLNAYSLNIVYYSTKSEIRVTASPLVGIVPDYSIMIIQENETPNTDYEISIHTPESPEFDSWLNTCNQQMPGGGQKPRKFGWF